MDETGLKLPFSPFAIGVKVTLNRDLKIKVFRLFPRTANVKKSRDQGLAVRFAV